MENAPNIIMFWYFMIAIFVLMIASIVTAIVWICKGKKQSDNRIQRLGKICLVLGAMCAVPIIFVVGYILYLY